MTQKVKLAVSLTLATLLLLSSVLGVVGCAKEAPAPAPAPKPAPAPVPKPAPAPKPAPVPKPTTPFPEKNITWIVMYGPGGGFDAYARAIGRVMPKYLPKKVDIIVRNMTGAGGRRGVSYVYRAKPDGYTIGYINLPGNLASQLVMPVEYDTHEFTYIGQHSDVIYVMSVPVDGEFKTIEDMQKATRPIKLSSEGAGSTGYIASIIFPTGMGMKPEIVTGYKSAAEDIIAALRGDVDAVIEGSISTHMPYIKSGDLIPLVVFRPDRDPRLPDVPSCVELGFNGGMSALAAHRIVVAPPDTPKEVADILEEALRLAVADKEVQAWSKEAERPLHWLSAEDSKAMIKPLGDLLGQYKHLLE